MKVYINDNSLEIFRGAKAIDAIRKYLVAQGDQPDCIPSSIRDQWGNEIAPDSPLHMDSRIYVDFHSEDSQDCDSFASPAS